MADMFSILSANYKAVGLTVPSETPYVVVDPVLYQGNWTGKYANNKSFKITISNVTVGSSLAVGGESTHGRALGQVEGVEIGATAQHGFIGELLHHHAGPGIDDLVDDRGRGAIENHLTRSGNIHRIGF